MATFVEDRGDRLLEELRQAGQAEQASVALRQLVQREIDDRAMKGCPSVSAEHGDNELPFFRRSVLKELLRTCFQKRLSDVLFDQRTIVRDAGVS